jgi:hypothetical protein
MNQQERNNSWHMKRVGLVILLTVGFVVHAFGGVNNETHLKDGTIIIEDKPGYYIPYGHTLLTDKFPAALKRMDSLWKVTNDIDYYSDYGLIFILEGKYEEAKNIYLEIEKIKPGRYETASNLGTVYELLGDNKKALKWVKKAIAIYPESHMDSEWLHVKILEAKIKGSDQFITSDFLLNHNFGRATIPTRNLTQSQLLHLKNALFFQLNERVTFIKPRDKIMAQLLFDMGNVLALSSSPYEATVLYEQAKTYGCVDPLLEVRLNYFKQLKVDTDTTVNTQTNKALHTPVAETNHTLLVIVCVCLFLFPVVSFLVLKGMINRKDI